MLLVSCSLWQHHFVPTTTVKMSQPATADARPWRTVMNELVIAIGAHDRRWRGAASVLTSSSICHDKCPARAGNSRINSVPRPGGLCQLTMVGLARIFHSHCEARRAVAARCLAAPFPPVITNVPSIDKATWFPNLTRPWQKRRARR